MKIFQRFCAAVVLTMALALHAFAGEIGCPGIVADPTPAPTITGVPSTSSTPTSNPATEAVLSLIQIAATVF